MESPISRLSHYGCVGTKYSVQGDMVVEREISFKYTQKNVGTLQPL